MEQPIGHVSFEDFLAWEERQESMHELIGGRIVAFPGETMDHADIGENVLVILRQALQPPCQARGSSTIVETIRRRRQEGHRPDVSVTCTPADSGRAKWVSRPRIVIEVRSEADRQHPREWDAKMREYWDTDWIEQLVVIESEERAATSYVRDPKGRRRPTEIEGDGPIEFPGIAVTISLDDAYDRTTLSRSRGLPSPEAETAGGTPERRAGEAWRC